MLVQANCQAIPPLALAPILVPSAMSLPKLTPQHHQATARSGSLRAPAPPFLGVVWHPPPPLPLTPYPRSLVILLARPGPSFSQLAHPQPLLDW